VGLAPGEGGLRGGIAGVLILDIGRHHHKGFGAACWQSGTCGISDALRSALAAFPTVAPLEILEVERALVVHDIVVGQPPAGRFSATMKMDQDMMPGGGFQNRLGELD